MLDVPLDDCGPTCHHEIVAERVEEGKVSFEHCTDSRACVIDRKCPGEEMGVAIVIATERDVSRSSSMQNAAL